MDTKLRIAGYAAIVSAIILIPIFIMGFLTTFLGENLLFKFGSLILLAIGLIVGLLILRGFIILSEKLKLNFLKTMTYIAIIFILIFTFVDIINLFYKNKLFDFLTIVLIVLFGIAYILFGVSVLPLRNKFGGIAKALGILYIIDGVFYVTVFLMLLTPLTGIASSILEIILFFRASKKF